VAGLPDGQNTAVSRLAVRLGPTDRFGIRTSLTLSVEFVTNPTPDFYGFPVEGADGSSPWRPGLTLEMWFL